MDLIKPQKNMFGVVISPMHFDLVLFCYSILVFAILTIKKKEFDRQRLQLKVLSIPKDI